ncbi:MAG TPA: tRNA (guanosine(37)-N1)-methyltransferase TrmD [bacterium]|nr:tRNA (guanosine(37)-N1)-methyltransferase TrmD [bacterium]
MSTLRIDIITAFPKMIDDALGHSIVGRAAKKGLVQIRAIDLRTYTQDRHRTIDDTPYGGGGGMLIKPEPMFACIEDVLQIPPITSANHVRDVISPDTDVIMTSPMGQPFDQKKAVEFSLKKHLVFICGHYKGIDERVHEKLVTQSVSIGDYVLTGGEIPVLAMVDATVRLLPGAIGDAQSALTDSFQEGVLDCPYYTRPENFRGMKVPEVLLQGHHEAIQTWREEQRLAMTRKLRPDLIRKEEVLKK